MATVFAAGASVAALEEEWWETVPLQLETNILKSASLQNQEITPDRKLHILQAR